MAGGAHGTQTELAERMGVHVQQVNMIIKGKRAVTAATNLPLDGSTVSTSCVTSMVSPGNCWRSS